MNYKNTRKKPSILPLLAVPGIILVFSMCTLNSSAQKSMEKKEKPATIISTQPDKPVSKLSTMKDTGRWMTYYYLYPSPENTEKAIQILAKDGILKRKTSITPMVGFFSGLFQANPDKLASWVASCKKLDDPSKETIVRALWNTDSKEAKDQMKVLIATMGNDYRKKLSGIVDSKPQPIAERQVNSPALLDMLWGRFFATGDKVYVERIASVLPLLKDLNARAEGGDKSRRVDLARTLVGGAAQFSLRSNCVQHNKVYRICDELRTDKTLQPYIDKVIAQAAEMSRQKRTRSQ